MEQTRVSWAISVPLRHGLVEGRRLVADGVPVPHRTTELSQDRVTDQLRPDPGPGEGPGHRVTPSLELVRGGGAELVRALQGADPVAGGDRLLLGGPPLLLHLRLGLLGLLGLALKGEVHARGDHHGSTSTTCSSETQWLASSTNERARSRILKRSSSPRRASSATSSMAPMLKPGWLRVLSAAQTSSAVGTGTGGRASTNLIISLPLGPPLPRTGQISPIA